MDTLFFTIGQNQAIANANFKALAKIAKNHNKAMLLMDLSMLGLLALNHIHQSELLNQQKEINSLKDEIDNLKKLLRSEEDELK